MNWTKIISHVEWACMNNGVHSSHIGAGITTEYRDRCRELLPKLLNHVIEMDYQEIYEDGFRSLVFDERDTRDYLAYN